MLPHVDHQLSQCDGQSVPGPHGFGRPNPADLSFRNALDVQTNCFTFDTGRLYFTDTEAAEAPPGFGNITTHPEIVRVTVEEKRHRGEPDWLYHKNMAGLTPAWTHMIENNLIQSYDWVINVELDMFVMPNRVRMTIATYTDNLKKLGMSSSHRSLVRPHAPRPPPFPSPCAAHRSGIVPGSMLHGSRSSRYAVQSARPNAPLPAVVRAGGSLELCFCVVDDHRLKADGHLIHAQASQERTVHSSSVSGTRLRSTVPSSRS